MEVRDLAGKTFWLSGADSSSVRLSRWGDSYQHADQLAFVLDGDTYVAVEDANDGYRSSLGELYVVSGSHVTNTFPPVLVRGVYLDKRPRTDEDAEYYPSYEEWDILRLVDDTSGETIIEVGTTNTDDYYPSCVLYFNPRNLPWNQEFDN